MRSAGAKGLRNWAEDAPPLSPWLFIPLIVGLGLLVAFNIRLRERLVFALRLRFGLEAPPAQAASLFYQRMLRLVERAGWHKPASQTPVEFAATLPAGEIGSPVVRFTNLCMAARFGGENVELSRFAALLEEIKVSLRRASYTSRTKRSSRN